MKKALLIIIPLLCNFEDEKEFTNMDMATAYIAGYNHALEIIDKKIDGDTISLEEGRRSGWVYFNVYQFPQFKINSKN